jgi:hypothetical protein
MNYLIPIATALTISIPNGIKQPRKDKNDTDKIPFLPYFTAKDILRFSHKYITINTNLKRTTHSRRQGGTKKNV